MISLLNSSYNNKDDSSLDDFFVEDIDKINFSYSSFKVFLF